LRDPLQTMIVAMGVSILFVRAQLLQS